MMKGIHFGIVSRFGAPRRPDDGRRARILVRNVIQLQGINHWIVGFFEVFLSSDLQIGPDADAIHFWKFQYWTRPNVVVFGLNSPEIRASGTLAVFAIPDRA
jgi:hypothetical protein